MSERIHIKYQLVASEGDVRTLARKIAIEQSVEAPESVINGKIEAACVGQIEHIEPISDLKNNYYLDLSYPNSMLSEQYNQLLNLCFGNVSMYPNVRLVDIKVPNSSYKYFQGPNFGIQGVRKKLGVYGRPLLATALKPRGQSNEYFADLAYQFASGGGDIIKDDQNLIGNFEEFKKRTQICLNAIDKGIQKSGKSCFYFPFISAPFEQLEKYFEWIVNHGAHGVLLSPLILGLDAARGWAKKYDLIYMAHPAFTGSYCIQSSHGMAYQLLYGLLFRLAGVDISVFPNQGGRFSFKKEDCKNIAIELHKPLDNILSAFPCPAGGMHYDDLSTMCDWFGPDAVFLLGGSLLEYSASVTESTRAFKNKIGESFQEKLISPASETLSSACEIGDARKNDISDYLQFSNYKWEGRDEVVYKETTTLPFKGMRRIELIGKAGEKSGFDLRYFEIEPQGYSSLEKHHHTHVIIGARGIGEIEIDKKCYVVNQNDVLYIKPLAIHQLRNLSDSPFGFYCIVDKQRDKPQAPDPN